MTTWATSDQRPKEGRVELAERWAADRASAREWLDGVEDAELRAATDQIDELLAGLAAGENVEPFQFSAETQRNETLFRLLTAMDRWLGDL
jgi:hypothetical protein